jgi:jasmonate ZIM domain-containing protein
MELFPQKSGSVMEEVTKKVDFSVNKTEPETAQMTIFYAGQVIVLNDLPADKAKEIMLLASNGSSHNLGAYASMPVQKPIQPTNLVATNSSTPVQKPIQPTNLVPTNSSIVSNIGTNMAQERVQQPPKHIVADMPKIARKASLTRFLEKRKDRITTRAPYETSKTTAFPPKPAQSKSWLGLAAQSPVQFEGQMY